MNTAIPREIFHSSGLGIQSEISQAIELFTSTVMLDIAVRKYRAVQKDRKYIFVISSSYIDRF